MHHVIMKTVTGIFIYSAIIINCLMNDAIADNKAFCEYEGNYYCDSTQKCLNAQDYIYNCPIEKQ